MIVFAPILGDIAATLSVDMGTATNLMMGFVVSVAFVLTFGGFVCDKYGITMAIILGLLCTSLPAVLMPILGNSYTSVLIGRLVQGASVGFVFATIGPILALWFPPEEQGLAAGIIFGSISLGSTLGVIASPALFAALGSWPKMVAVMSIPGWIAIVLVLLFTRKSPSPKVIQALEAAIASGSGNISFGKAISLPKTWLITMVIICNTWGLYCLYNLVPAYLGAPSPMGVGLPPVSAGNLSLTLTSVGIFAPFVGGLFFDKIAKGNPKPAVILGFLLSGLFTYLILQPSVYGNMTMLALCLMLAGWGIPFMTASLSATIAVSYPTNIIGRMMGFCFGIGTFGGALGLFLGGKSIAVTGSFFTSLALISGAAVAGIGLMAFFRTKQPSGTEEAVADAALEIRK
jgi:predicted MFS family arabinose efflux permease